MHRLMRLHRWLAQRAEDILALLLLSMFVTFILQIVFRYLLNLPIGWTVEWVSIAWLWGILFGYAFVVKETEVIRLDVLYSAVPVGMRRVFDVLSGATIAVVFAWTLPATWEFVDFMKIERTAYMRIPFNIVFAVYIPFAIAVILRSLMTAWAGLTGRGSQFDKAVSPETHEYD
jgi:C4-dicarboxylate transporter DctQ subunit